MLTKQFDDVVPTFSYTRQGQDHGTRPASACECARAHSHLDFAGGGASSISTSPKFCSRSPGSNAFAAGQVKRQVTPEGA
jgi:hypothetical protein